MCDAMFMWGASSLCMYASLIYRHGNALGMWQFADCSVVIHLWQEFACCLFLPELRRPIPRLQWGSKPCSRCALWLCTMLRVATKPDQTVSPVPAFNRKWRFEDRRSYMQLSSWEWLGKLNMGQLTFALLFKHILSVFIITPFLKE